MKKIVTYDRIGLVHIAGMLNPAECNALVALATASEAKDATVVDEQTGEHFLHNDRRCQMFWPDQNHDLIRRISAGIARLTGLPQESQEPMQILRYLPGGEYKPHFDAFPQGAPDLAHGGNRILTVIFYLNNVIKGGGTAFPEAGLTVEPLLGTGVVFRSLRNDGSVDPFSLHAGLPVLAGEKWIMTCWIRQGAYK